GIFSGPQIVPKSKRGNFGSIAVGPKGQVLVNYQMRAGGTASSASNGPPVTLTDTNQNWTPGLWASQPILIIKSDFADDVGQINVITSNDVNQLNLAGAWGVVPHAGDTYVIGNQERGTATTVTPASPVTVTDSSFPPKNWITDQWKG